jgi:hypothetical protein
MSEAIITLIVLVLTFWPYILGTVVVWYLIKFLRKVSR